VAYSVPISFTLVEDENPKTTQDVTATDVNGSINQVKVPLSSITTIVSKTDTGKKTVKLNINAAARPLYIIDGKEASDLTLIDPNMVESVSVVKDAAATSIYGPKGKNGVVVIATKKAKPAPATIVTPQKEPETKH
jgi:TonB-dependent SusC/RagA subfamily outer membrane receptor